jgi:hypothetical protein
MKFSDFIEGRDEQLKQINRGLNLLVYQHGLDPKTVATTPSNELIAMLGTEIPPDWDAHRYVAAIRSNARHMSMEDTV